MGVIFFIFIINIYNKSYRTAIQADIFARIQNGLVSKLWDEYQNKYKVYNQIRTIEDMTKIVRKYLFIDHFYCSSIRFGKPSVSYLLPLSQEKFKFIQGNREQQFNIKNGFVTNKKSLHYPHGLKEVKMRKSNNIVGIMILVINYAPGDQRHNNHAIAAFKIDDTLYCFNPWGIQTKWRRDIPDFEIWDHLKNIYNCKNIKVYYGINLQQPLLGNTKGNCVPLSVNYIALIYYYIFYRYIIDRKIYNNKSLQEAKNELKENLDKTPSNQLAKQILDSCFIFGKSFTLNGTNQILVNEIRTKMKAMYENAENGSKQPMNIYRETGRKYFFTNLSTMLKKAKLDTVDKSRSSNISTRLHTKSQGVTKFKNSKILSALHMKQ